MLFDDAAVLAVFDAGEFGDELFDFGIFGNADDFTPIESHREGIGRSAVDQKLDIEIADEVIGEVVFREDGLEVKLQEGGVFVPDPKGAKGTDVAKKGVSDGFGDLL